jgi:hypothetical protein
MSDSPPSVKISFRSEESAVFVLKFNDSFILGPNIPCSWAMDTGAC